MDWKGYGNEHDQWIAETGLPHVKEAIKEYCYDSKVLKLVNKRNLI